MINVEMLHTNIRYRKPHDWDEKQYSDLHITNQDGKLYSYWQPTFKEKLQILFGRFIRIAIVSNVQPPIAVDTHV